MGSQTAKISIPSGNSGSAAAAYLAAGKQIQDSMGSFLDRELVQEKLRADAEKERVANERWEKMYAMQKAQEDRQIEEYNRKKAQEEAAIAAPTILANYGRDVVTAEQGQAMLDKYNAMGGTEEAANAVQAMYDTNVRDYNSLVDKVKAADYKTANAGDIARYREVLSGINMGSAQGDVARQKLIADIEKPLDDKSAYAKDLALYEDKEKIKSKFDMALEGRKHANDVALASGKVTKEADPMKSWTSDQKNAATMTALQKDIKTNQDIIAKGVAESKKYDTPAKRSTPEYHALHTMINEAWKANQPLINNYKLLDKAVYKDTSDDKGSVAYSDKDRTKWLGSINIPMEARRFGRNDSTLFDNFMGDTDVQSALASGKITAKQFSDIIAAGYKVNDDLEDILEDYATRLTGKTKDY